MKNEGEEGRRSDSVILSLPIMTDAMIEQIFWSNAESEEATFTVLTKRAERMYNFIAERKYELDL